MQMSVSRWNARQWSIETGENDIADRRGCPESAYSPSLITLAAIPALAFIPFERFKYVLFFTDISTILNHERLATSSQRVCKPSGNHRGRRFRSSLSHNVG